MDSENLARTQVNSAFKLLRSIPGNNSCFECALSKRFPQPLGSPTWASMSFGIFLCMNCAALHRALGVHVSFVRSTLLDDWTLRQIRRMKVGGNTFAAQSTLSKSEDISFRYSNAAASAFKEELDELVAKDSISFPTFEQFMESLQTIHMGQSTQDIPIQDKEPEQPTSSSSHLSKLGIKKIAPQSKQALDFDELTEKATALELVSACSPTHTTLPHTPQPAEQVNEEYEPSLSEIEEQCDFNDRLGMGGLRRKLQSQKKPSTPSREMFKGTSSQDYFATNREEDERRSLERLRSLRHAEAISSEDFNPKPHHPVQRSPTSSLTDLTQTGIESLKSFISKSKSKVRVCLYFRFTRQSTNIPLVATKIYFETPGQ